MSSDGAYWQDAYNRKANNGPACFDARHNCSIGGSVRPAVRQEPEVRVRNWSKPVDLILGGWKFDYFMNAHSRLPGHA